MPVTTEFNAASINTPADSIKPVRIFFGQEKAVTEDSALVVGLEYLSIDGKGRQTTLSEKDQQPLSVKPDAKIIIAGRHLNIYDHILFAYPRLRRIRPVSPMFFKFNAEGGLLSLSVPNYGDGDEKFRIILTSFRPEVLPLWIEQPFLYTTEEDQKEAQRQKEEAEEQQKKAEAEQEKKKEREEAIKHAGEEFKIKKPVEAPAAAAQQETEKQADDFWIFNSALFAVGGWAGLAGVARKGAEVVLGARLDGAFKKPGSPDTAAEKRSSLGAAGEFAPEHPDGAIEQSTEYLELKKQLKAKWIAEHGTEADRAGADPELTDYKAEHSQNAQGLSIGQQAVIAFKQQFPKQYAQVSSRTGITASTDADAIAIQSAISEKQSELLSQGLPAEEAEAQIRQFEKLQWDQFVARYPGKAVQYAAGDRNIAEAVRRAGLSPAAGAAKPLTDADKQALKQSQFSEQIKNLRAKGAGLEQKLQRPGAGFGGSGVLPQRRASEGSNAPGLSAESEPAIASSQIPGQAGKTRAEQSEELENINNSAGRESGGAFFPQPINPGMAAEPAETEAGMPEQDGGESALERLRQNQQRAADAVIKSNSFGAGMVRKAAESAAGKVAEKEIGAATSQVWYYGFASSAATFFTGLDFMLGAVVMDFYWFVLHRRNKELFPMSLWQKVVSVFATIFPPILAVLFLVLVVFTICNHPLYKTISFFSGEAAVCKNFNVSKLGSNLGSYLNPQAPAAPVGGSCSTAVSGPASAAALGLSCFGINAPYASAISNAESGGDPFSLSRADKCTDTDGTLKSVSVGLFQINLTAHKIGNLNCPAAFDRMLTGSQTCNIIDDQLYNNCVAAAEDAQANIAAACQISGDGQHWGAWSTDKLCGFTP